jgi:hypothetical protein
MMRESERGGRLVFERKRRWRMTYETLINGIQRNCAYKYLVEIRVSTTCQESVELVDMGQTGNIDWKRRIQTLTRRRR